MLGKNLLLLGILCGLLLNATSQAQTCIQPDKLVFSVVPTGKKTPELSIYKPLAQAIEKQLNISVELKKFYSYRDIVTALVQEQLHFARMGAFSYIIAANTSEFIKPFAAHYHASSPPFQKQGTFYQSILIVHADSAYQEIADLKGKSVLLTTQGSTSGSLVPRVLFAKQVNIEKLDDFFSEIFYSGRHDNSVLAVINKKFDAAFVASRNLSIMSENGLLKPEQIRVLWQSKPIPHGPFVYNDHLCENYKNAIRQATFNIHKSPQGKIMMHEVGALRFAPADSEDYDVVRELAEQRH